MDINWQQETWLAKIHLAPGMPELNEQQHMVQNKVKFTGIVAALCPTENEEDQVKK